MGVNTALAVLSWAIHTYIHIYTHTYIHTYIHTYKHTYIHTYITVTGHGHGVFILATSSKEK
jgi:hypothetical protein